MKNTFLLVFIIIVLAACASPSGDVQVIEAIATATAVPSSTLTPIPTPTPTPDVMTIEELAQIPSEQRELMMFEATGIDFTTSDETPHLEFEVVQGEDGTYSIDRVYNILTGEMVDIPQRADNVGSDTFTYVDQDWSVLPETFGNVQVFPRVDGKGVVVLSLTDPYKVFADDPNTEAREYLTKKAPENFNKIELPTFTSFTEAMEYAIFVKGARHNHVETSRLAQNSEIYKEYQSHFYGGTVLTAGDITTPEGRITFSIGARLLPTGDVAITFADLNGVVKQIIVPMVDGLDANGHSVTDIVDMVKTATGDPTMMSTRSNPEAPNPLPLIPDDF